MRCARGQAWAPESGRGSRDVQGVSRRSAGESVQTGAASEPSLPMGSLCSHELAGCQELWGHLQSSPGPLSHGLPEGRGREEVGQLGRGAREVPASRTTFEAAPWAPKWGF